MQGMMLSERPAPSISTGMVDSSISIGNYKGVMLCNRPFAGAQGVGGSGSGTATGGGPAKHVFNCGAVAEEVGLNRRRSDMNAVKRTKKETALTRHRKWLADLQRTKEAADKAFADEAAAKDETKKKFMDREAKLRAIVRSGSKEERGGERTSNFMNTMETTAESKDEETPKSESKSESKSETQSNNAELDAAAKKRTKSGRASMPMWALTEDKAAEVTQVVEEDELDDLLEFAKNLDFDKYMGDMEVSTMLATVKARIAELENMPDADDEFEKQDVLRGDNRAQVCDQFIYALYYLPFSSLNELKLLSVSSQLNCFNNIKYCVICFDYMLLYIK
mmetsp:Transcript_14459/g.17190  ORF Transcript_14459/g.17190 Transcript_14459/m.17190 type:complete len:335 (+) Transcript_14459:35-1039(+)